MLLVNSTDGYAMGVVDTIWPTVFVFIIAFVIYAYRNQIRNSKSREIIPYVLFVLMVIFELKMFVSILVGPFVDWTLFFNGLPLHLCSTSAVLVMLYTSTRKQVFLDILVIQGIVGAIITFIFPSSTAFPYEFEYYRFFLSHTLLFITPVYFMIIEGTRVNKIILKKAFLWIHIFALVAVTVNLITGYTDFMYLLPDNTRNLYHYLPINEVVPFFSHFPMVVVFGEILTLVVYFCVYYLLRKVQNLFD